MDLNWEKLYQSFSKLHAGGANCPTNVAGNTFNGYFVNHWVGLRQNNVALRHFERFVLTLLWHKLLASAWKIMAARGPNVQQKRADETDEDEQSLGNDSPYRRGSEAEDEGDCCIPTRTCDWWMRQIVCLFCKFAWASNRSHLSKLITFLRFFSWQKTTTMSKKDPRSATEGPILSEVVVGA